MDEGAVIKESVWDYPRPPRLEPTPRRLRVLHDGMVVAETVRGMRILETSHPPVYYFPARDVRMEWMKMSRRRGTFCEFKGVATYWSLALPERRVVDDIAWSYAQPTGSYGALQDCLAFYASRVDECWVDEELVVSQPGDFYGGWITSHVAGPFKGAAGTLGW